MHARDAGVSYGSRAPFTAVASRRGDPRWGRAIPGIAGFLRLWACAASATEPTATAINKRVSCFTESLLGQEWSECSAALCRLGRDAELRMLNYVAIKSIAGWMPVCHRLVKDRLILAWKGAKLPVRGRC